METIGQLSLTSTMFYPTKTTLWRACCALPLLCSTALFAAVSASRGAAVSESENDNFHAKLWNFRELVAADIGDGPPGNGSVPEMKLQSAELGPKARAKKYVLPSLSGPKFYVPSPKAIAKAEERGDVEFVSKAKEGPIKGGSNATAADKNRTDSAGGKGAPDAAGAATGGAGSMISRYTAYYQEKPRLRCSSRPRIRRQERAGAFIRHNCISLGRGPEVKAVS